MILTSRFQLPIILFNYAPVAAKVVVPLLTTQSDIFHACEAETAMMLRSAARAGGRWTASRPAPIRRPLDEPELYRWRSVSALTKSGVIEQSHGGRRRAGTKNP